MADIYTRDQIVRKLKRLQAKLAGIECQCGWCPDCHDAENYDEALAEAIALFPPKKRGKK